MDDVSEPSWTFLSNYAHVLLCVAENPDARVRDMAQLVGITERAVQRILRELELAGVLKTEKRGRRNHYEIAMDAALRHPLESHRSIGDLLSLLKKTGFLEEGGQQELDEGSDGDPD